jgi:phosphatidylinositol alpha-1,6-mannosyltransferase
MKNGKIKICILSNDFSQTLGGIAAVTENISFHLPKNDEVSIVKVFAFKNRESSFIKANNKLEISKLKTKFLLSLCFQIFNVVIKNKDCDLFHATSVFPVGFFAVIFAKFIFRKPVFVSYYGTDLLTNHGSFLTKWAKKFTVIHSSRAIAFSDSTKHLVEQKLKIPENKSTVINYPMPDQFELASPSEIKKIKNEFKIFNDDFVVLFVGNLVNRKGVHDLLKAVLSLKEDKIKLVFVGDGIEKNKLIDEAGKENIGRKIIFAGRQPKLAPFYELASVFSMPSFYDKTNGDVEGMGVVFLEAARYSLPSIATISGGIPEAIKDNETGLLVKERDINALAEKIVYLKNNPSKIKELGENAKKFVEEKFNWRKSIKDHVELYKTFL